jgi:bacteriocin-like protein
MERKGPIELTEEQLDQVTGGVSPADQTQNPNDLNNGTNANSNGKSGAPGNSFHPGR